MIKLDHLTIPVRDHAVARVEQSSGPVGPGAALYFQVDDVDAFHATLTARGVAFSHPPRKTFWGYGPELTDPDRYRVRRWDERTMREKA